MPDDAPQGSQERFWEPIYSGLGDPDTSVLIDAQKGGDQVLRITIVNHQGDEVTETTLLPGDASDLTESLRRWRYDLIKGKYATEE